MLDSFMIAPLPPASKASPANAKPASAPANEGGDTAGFKDALAQSTQDAQSGDAATTNVATPGEEDRKTAAEDAETAKPDIATAVAELLAMMGADNAAAVVPPASLPPPPAPPVRLAAAGDGNVRAVENAAPEAVVALGLPKTSAGSKPDPVATKPAASALAAKSGAEEPTESAARNDAPGDAFKFLTAAPVLAKTDAERGSATTPGQGSAVELPAAVNVAAAGTMPLHSPPSAAPATIASLVPTHLDSPAWSKDFGQHVIRLAIDGQPAAEIHLNPPDLGPIKVSIDMKGSETTLQFSAEHASTRDALEASLPRLREIFAAGGLTLTEANVDSQPQSQSQAGFSQHHPGRQQGGFDWAQAMKDAGRQGIQFGVDDGSVAIASSTASATPRRAALSQVDLFA